MTDNVNKINTIDEVKRPKGRPKKHDILYNSNQKEYYKEFYHLKNKSSICECGSLIKGSKTKHLKREVHKRKLEFMNKT